MKKIFILISFFLLLVCCDQQVTTNNQENNNNITDNSNDNTSDTGNINDNTNDNKDKYAQITFFNESSYKVDIYRYINPADFDPDLLVTSINAGETKKVSVIESFDQEIGDVFYIRYNVLLADKFETGIDNIYVQAERDMSNLAFVVTGGQKYTKTIVQPEKNQLSFINSYLKVFNASSKSYSLINGSSYLSRLGDDKLQVEIGDICYYEIPITYPLTTYNMVLLKLLEGGTYTEIEDFTMEKGYLYTLKIKDSGIDSVEKNKISIQ